MLRGTISSLASSVPQFPPSIMLVPGSDQRPGQWFLVADASSTDRRAVPTRNYEDRPNAQRLDGRLTDSLRYRTPSIATPLSLALTVSHDRACTSVHLITCHVQSARHDPLRSGAQGNTLADGRSNKWALDWERPQPRSLAASRNLRAARGLQTRHWGSAGQESLTSLSCSLSPKIGRSKF